MDPVAGPSHPRPQTPSKVRRRRASQGRTTLVSLAISFLSLSSTVQAVPWSPNARGWDADMGATWVRSGMQPRAGEEGRFGAFTLDESDPAPALDPLRGRYNESGVHNYDGPVLEASRRAGLSLSDSASGGVGKLNRLFTTTQGSTFPPSDWLDINNITTLTMLSDEAILRMQTWLQTNGQYEWTPWWQFPVAGIAYADMDLATASQKNQEIVTNLLNQNENGVSWMIDKYIDDQLWWGLFALKGYQLYGNDSWLQGAGKIQRNSSQYWDSTCGGGVLWLTYKPDIKNTITNALYLSLNSRLYRMTGQSYYYNETMRTLNWWLKWAFDPTTGRVYDTIAAPDCQPAGLQIYTYNSGVVLAGLVDTYLATGNTTILDVARTIAYAGMRDYSDPSSGILREACEHDTTPTPQTPSGCGQDQIAFKGIFMAGLSYLYAARPTDINIYNYINTQLLSNAFNNLDDSWLFGQWWNGPWNVTTAGPKTQISALSMLSSAVVADVAFNAEVQALGTASS